MGEGTGRWSSGRPVNNGKLFSFSNQLLHFSLDTICLRVERERASLRKIFLIVDYILPGYKGARDGRRSSWWCKKCVLIWVVVAAILVLSVLYVPQDCKSLGCRKKAPTLPSARSRRTILRFSKSRNRAREEEGRWCG